MSDLFPMYARLRGTLAAEQPTTPVSPCRHPRSQRRIERTSAFVPGTARYSGYVAEVTTTIHCDGCDTVIGSETHRERRR
ncbi:hypothetical protein H7J86_26185 [Mycobacterium hackensackense]|uniref:hypothetical protein n=1 Tax=Mycobacterium hackensackense TaxID=228909 RepID=UPI002265BD67|nr:hypothetical protein [Mycobacterium hackensackense]MCV7255658.1 hypothetical protein [Mycobacterium hackensackense]